MHLWHFFFVYVCVCVCVCGWFARSGNEQINLLIVKSIYKCRKVFPHFYPLICYWLSHGRKWAVNSGKFDLVFSVRDQTTEESPPGAQRNTSHLFGNLSAPAIAAAERCFICDQTFGSHKIFIFLLWQSTVRLVNVAMHEANIPS